MSKDVFEKYQKRGTTTSRAFVPRESEVLRALYLRNQLLLIIGGVGVVGLAALYIFAPVTFLIVVAVLGGLTAVASLIYGLAIMFKNFSYVGDVLGRAKTHGVAEDD